MKRCLLSLAAAACLFLASCSFQSGSELLDSSLLAAPVPEEPPRVNSGSRRSIRAA